jgi:hypothetical protein
MNVVQCQVSTIGRSFLGVLLSVMRLSVTAKRHRGGVGTRGLSSHEKRAINFFKFTALVVLFVLLIVGHV